MDTVAARAQLAAIDRIVSAADRSLHLPPVIFVVWGLVGVTINGLHQAQAFGLPVPPDQFVHLPMILAAVALTTWVERRRSDARQTVVDSVAGLTFAAVFAVLLVVNVTAQHVVVPAAAMALFWSAGFSIALLVVGLQASRPLLVGGVALLAATGVAGLVPPWFHGTLALGWAAGFVLPGLVLFGRRSRGRAAAV